MSVQQFVIQSSLNRNGKPLLSLEVSEDDAASVVITISGEMDMNTDDLLTELVEQVAGQRPDRVVLDMAAVRFFCAGGIHTLIRAQTTVTEAGGQLVLRRPSAMTRLVLEITGADRLFTVSPALGSNPGENGDH